MHTDSVSFFVFYMNGHIHVAFSGNPALHPAMQHMNPSAPDNQGDVRIKGFGEKGLVRNLFVHE
jgi:hypothetical protein